MDSPDEYAHDDRPVRDISKLVVEHPVPIYDPRWLRRLHERCLWDGGISGDSEFCRPECAERYAEWEHRTTHVIAGREPLQTFVEYGMVKL